MNILITGATGGLGQLFSKMMADYSKEKVIISGRSDLPSENYRRCDLTQPGEVKSLLSDLRPTKIFHLAGNFGNDFTKAMAVNALSAKHIFDTILMEDIKARVVIIGSAAEYGMVLPEENPIPEDRLLRPVSIYGLTKAFQTQMAHYYAHNHGVDVVVARVFNLLMPGLSEKLFVGRVERKIAQVRRGEIKKILIGNLKNQRDYVSGEEAFRQICFIAEKGQSGEIYHVGSGKPKKIRELLDGMLNKAGLDWSFVGVENSYSNRSGYDVPVIYADMKKTLSLDGNGYAKKTTDSDYTGF